MRDVDAGDFPSTEPIEEQAWFLLRYAVLAPSSHNSQPWRFKNSGYEIDVAAEEARWLDATDPDRREPFLIVGCAVENLCVAAEHVGFDAPVEYREPGGTESVVTVTLGDDGESSNRRPSGLLDALTERYTSHDLFDGRPVPIWRPRSTLVVPTVTVRCTPSSDFSGLHSCSRIRCRSSCR